VKYWEIIADNLSKAGFSWGCVAAIDSNGRTIFICDDDDTSNCLIEAGAPRHSVYTRPELLVLLEHHRQTPLSVLELLRIHHAKRMFNGRIAE
jgi:hypothetical protein